MKIDKYDDEVKFSHFQDGLLSDREIYLTKKENDMVSITLEDGEYYSLIQMTTQECAEMIIEFTDLLNIKTN